MQTEIGQEGITHKCNAKRQLNQQGIKLASQQAPSASYRKKKKKTLASKASHSS